MTPVEWAAIAASLGHIMELLGEHLPGVLIAAIALWAYARREKELREAAIADRALAQERTKEAQELTRMVLTGLASVKETVDSFVESCNLDARMDKLEALSKPQEVKRRGKVS